MIRKELLNHIHIKTGFLLHHSQTLKSEVNAAIYEVAKPNGDLFLLKTFAESGKAIGEVNGLLELRKAKTIDVVEPIWWDEYALLLPKIERNLRSKQFWTNFGRNLALLHRCEHFNFGFPENNYIGANLQLNKPSTLGAISWPDFYLENRLAPQMLWARERGLASAKLMHRFDKLRAKLPSLFGDFRIHPALLHGDLWAGNFLVNSQGEAILIDPATYYGHRETDLAMTMLFGGFDQRFYDAYAEAYPLDSEYESRINLYKLYHVLNHLNIFGSSYLYEAEELMQQYL